MIHREDEDLASIALPLAVEQLEIEVREEILHHTGEQSSASELTTLANGYEDEENEIPLTVNSIDDESTPTVQTSNQFIDSKEPNPIAHDTTTVLHSVDSIVNLPTVTDHEVQNHLMIFRRIIIFEYVDLHCS